MKREFVVNTGLIWVPNEGCWAVHFYNTLRLTIFLPETHKFVNTNKSENYLDVKV